MLEKGEKGSKVGKFRISLQKPITFFYTNKEQARKEITAVLSLTITPNIKIASNKPK